MQCSSDWLLLVRVVVEENIVGGDRFHHIVDIVHVVACAVCV